MSWPISDVDHILVDSAEMLDIESLILSKGLPVESLMEKVGNSIFMWLLEHKEFLADGVVFLIGPGHNGGDGLVVARELYNAGFEVSFWSPFKSRKKLTTIHYEYLKWLGVKEYECPPNPSGKELWIDSFFGLGQVRELEREINKLFIEREISMPNKLISIDVPSGICSDTGKQLSTGAAIASYTLTIGLVKQGLIQDLALRNVGKLVRIDIGIPKQVLNDQYRNKLLRIKREDLNTLKFPKPPINASKYNRGRVLIIAGSTRYPGAALLSLQGAFASGSGSIQAILPEKVASEAWKINPEVVVVQIFKSSIEDNDKLISFLENDISDRYESILIGPGLGRFPRTWHSISNSICKFKGLLVLDADGINELANTNESIKWLKERSGPTWITPHIREFQRLFPSFISLSPLEAAQKASSSSGASVLLKGANTIICDASQKKWQLTETAPWSARAGLGDLLSGLVAGVGSVAFLENQKLSGEKLAISAFLHSRAADSASEGSQASLIAKLLSQIVVKIQKSQSI